MLPNTFIAGAQKSGTSTLCGALVLHPEAVVSTPKEPAFFSMAANLGRLDAYESCFRARDGTATSAIIDGTNAYMVDAAALARIREMLGEELKFVFCLRAPVKRMISAYWDQVRKGKEARSLSEAFAFAGSSLEEAVQDEEERLDYAAAHCHVDLAKYAESFDDPKWNFRYLRNSLYARDLRRFQDTFGGGRIKILLFEEMVRDLGGALSSLAEFLNLDPDGFPESLDLHRNPTRFDKAPWLMAALRRLPARKLFHHMPGYEALSWALLYRRPPATDPETVVRLNSLVAPEVACLQAMLDRDLAEAWM